MRKKYFLLALCIVIFLSAGVALEVYIHPDNGLWVSRSGALVVAVGTAIGMINTDSVEIGDYMSPNRVDLFNRLKSNGESEKAHVLFFMWQQEFRDKILSYSGAVLISGTLIWGFGDLSFNFFRSFYGF